MSRLPIPHFINQIKTKLGFDRTLTASGEDVVDAINKQSQQLTNLGPENVLTSDSTTAALAAAQGKALNQQINNAVSNNFNTTPTLLEAGVIHTTQTECLIVVEIIFTAAQYNGYDVIINGITVKAIGFTGTESVEGRFVDCYRLHPGDSITVLINDFAGTTGTIKKYELASQEVNHEICSNTVFQW